MRVGYLLGGTLSLLLYKIDRRHMLATLKLVLKSKVKNEKVMDAIYLIFTVLVATIVYLIPESEGINGMVAFAVLEILGLTKQLQPKQLQAKQFQGNNFRKNISERKVFYSTVFLLGKSYVGTFITPLLIILIFGNAPAIVYGMIYFYFDELNCGWGEKILNIIFIIPSLIGDGLLYLVYICRNKTLKISFKGEFFQNLLYMPLLNIYILSAYIETVNFYHIENYEVVHYLRSYGRYNGKIDEVAIKDLVTIIYGVAGAAFILFIIFINLKYKM